MTEEELLAELPAAMQQQQARRQAAQATEEAEKLDALDQAATEYRKNQAEGGGVTEFQARMKRKQTKPGKQSGSTEKR